MFTSCYALKWIAQYYENAIRANPNVSYLSNLFNWLLAIQVASHFTSCESIPDIQSTERKKSGFHQDSNLGHVVQYEEVTYSTTLNTLIFIYIKKNTAVPIRSQILYYYNVCKMLRRYLCIPLATFSGNDLYGRYGTEILLCFFSSKPEYSYCTYTYRYSYCSC